MTFSPEIWASVAHAAIYLALILFPWMVGGGRVVAGIIGFGGVIALVVMDFYVGKSSDDMGLARDLMLLTLIKAVFFFLVSLLIERIFRAYLIKRSQEKPTDTGVDKAAQEKFDREMKSMKDRSEKFLGQ
jgi:membrane-bound ClpP family serine protease